MIVKGKNPKFSVVIPSYRSGNDLIRCLDSIRAQDANEDFEVIVVDSSPEDPSDSIQTRFPGVQVYHLKRRTLPGKARSTGARHAKGQIVFFTDADCVVGKDWIKQLLLCHDQGYDVAGGGIFNGTPGSLVGTTEYLLEFNEFTPWMKAREVRAVPSCNLSVNRRVFSETGYFPDFMKGEDTLFCENVVRSGRKIFFNPRATITHRNRTDFRKYILNQVALGEGAVEARRRARLRGFFLVKFPFLVPFIPVFRTLVIGKRLFFSSGRLFLSYLAHYPLIFPGLISHVWGFIRGPYRSGLSTERRQEKGSEGVYPLPRGVE